jgi:hypothetical protein
MKLQYSENMLAPYKISGRSINHAREDHLNKGKEKEMRKVWVVLLSIVLIMAFALPVSAADVKFSGSYVAQGYYDNNRTLLKDGGASVSNIWQRLRVQTDFKVQEGLMLTTRFDALEKIWGAPRAPITITVTTTGGTSTGVTSTSLAGNDLESENIKFTHAFVTLNVPGGFGVFRIGYMTQGTWATAFGDTGEQDYGMRFKWDWDTGTFFWGARWDKTEGKKYYSSLGPAGNVNSSTYKVDHDSEKYSVLGGYKWKTGDAGIQITYYLDTSNADDPTTGYKGKYWLFQPYARATFGIVYAETEFGFYTGKYREYNVENGTTRQNSEYQGWRGYVMASVDLAPAYVGGLAFFAAGDDIGTSDKNEGGVKIGTDFTPCLILFNYDLGRWNGVLGGQNGLTAAVLPAYNNDNVYAWQIFAGIKPIPKLDVKASFTMAGLDKSAVANQVSKDLGSELDITATYKIYDNLSYMVGFGYLFVGDAFKGSNAGANVDNDYLVTHKLTLTF